MANLKATTIMQQNPNTIAGIQVDTAVYVGTGLAGTIPIQVGREAPVYRLDGVQTAAVMDVILDTMNAYKGATFELRFGTGASGTSTVRLLNATTGGTVVSTSTSNVKASLFATFDGTTWR